MKTCNMQIYLALTQFFQAKKLSKTEDRDRKDRLLKVSFFRDCLMPNCLKI